MCSVQQILVGSSLLEEVVHQKKIITTSTACLYSINNYVLMYTCIIILTINLHVCLQIITVMGQLSKLHKCTLIGMDMQCTVE